MRFDSLLRMLAALIFVTLLHSCGVSQGKEWGDKEKKQYNEVIKASRKGDTKKALKNLDKLIKKYPENAELYARKGSILFENGNESEGIQNMEKAIEVDPEFNREVYFSLGLMHFEKKRFKEALPSIEKYMSYENLSSKRKEQITAMYNVASFAGEAYDNPVPFNPIKLGNGVNSTYSEYLPSLTANGQQIVFTRRIRGQEDIYISTKKDGEWQQAEPISGINTKDNEGAHVISADGKMILYTACNRPTGVGGCDIYQTTYGDGKWSEPSNLGPRTNSPNWESQPSISADKSIILFASNRTGGIGGNDLYMIKRMENGKWSRAINLGENINTSGDDESPYLHADGKSLYFRSNARPGMGSFDIYVTRYDDDTKKWSTPMNLGYPINTEGNEGSLSVSLDGTKAFFASDMEYLDKASARKNLDIYTFDLYEEARPQSMTYVEGKVTDSKTNLSLNARYQVISLETGDTLSQGRTEDGTFLLPIPVGAEVAFYIEEQGYNFASYNFKGESVQRIYEAYKVNVNLTPIEKKAADVVVAEEKPIVLNNIFFETGKSNLLSSSNYEIIKLANLLIENKTISVRIIGHTDNVGDPASNQVLSEQRAKAVKMALVSHGITDSRISILGLGESTPIASNETEAGRSQNRRTEFVIIR